MMTLIIQRNVKEIFTLYSPLLVHINTLFSGEKDHVDLDCLESTHSQSGTHGGDNRRGKFSTTTLTKNL